MGITDGEVLVKDEVVHTVKSLGWGIVPTVLHEA